MSTNKIGYFNLRIRALKSQDNRHFLGEREVETLKRVLSNDPKFISFADQHVVDLGCGDQYLKQAFEDCGANYRGIDIDECNLEFQSFPLASNTQDIAVCLALIEHLHDPGHFLSEILRVLKPGGLVWLSTPDIEACGSKFWNDPTHMHPYTRSSLRTLLRMNGFEDILVTPNYRCKPKHLYVDTDFNFYRARHLMPFPGKSKLPVPDLIKGGCTGLFAFAKKANNFV